MAWGSWDAVIKEFHIWLEAGRSTQRKASIQPESPWLKTSLEEYALRMLELAKTLEMHPIVSQVLPGTRLGSLVLWLPNRQDYQLLIRYVKHNKYSVWIEGPEGKVLEEQEDITREGLDEVIIAYLEKLASD